jgi:hypothetical protein
LDLSREYSITKAAKELVTFLDETVTNHLQIIGAKKLQTLLKKKAIGSDHFEQLIRTDYSSYSRLAS